MFLPQVLFRFGYPPLKFFVKVVFPFPRLCLPTCVLFFFLPGHFSSPFCLRRLPLPVLTGGPSLKPATGRTRLFPLLPSFGSIVLPSSPPSCVLWFFLLSLVFFFIGLFYFVSFRPMIFFVVWPVLPLLHLGCCGGPRPFFLATVHGPFPLFTTVSWCSPPFSFRGLASAVFFSKSCPPYRFFPVQAPPFLQVPCPEA